MITIVEEGPEHRVDVVVLHCAAFGGDEEANLIGRLRLAGLVAVALVAIEDGEVAGHVLFSDLDVEVDGRKVKAVALAPLAVRPQSQRQGIGGKLVQAGLDAVRQRGRAAAIVLGHAGYYPRFGFSATLARKLAAPFRGDSFMAIELAPRALEGRAGVVRYPAAFGR